MKKIRPILLSIVTGLLFAAVSLPAATGQTIVLINDSHFKTDAQAAIDSLYNSNPEGAREVLDPWVESFPDHPLWTLWDAMELWWTVVYDLYDFQYDEKFFHEMRRADYEASQLLRQQRDHPDALIIRAIANGYTARHHANRGEWVTAANIGRRAYQAYSRLMEVMPDLPDNDFAEGMKRYYAAYIPDRYPAVRALSWFLPDGDRQEGLNRLRISSDEGVFARPEATYFLGNILLNYEEDYENALGYFRALVDRYPENGFYRRLYARTLFQLRKSEELIQFARQSLDLWAQIHPESESVLQEELYYWKGRALFQSGRYEEARESFKTSYRIGRTLPEHKTRPFQSLSAYYAGRANERLANHDEAESYYRIVIDQRENDEVKRLANQRLRAIR